MSAFQRSVRELRESETICPKCGDQNIGRKHVITLDPHGHADCATCGHWWVPKDPHGDPVVPFQEK